jgi:hypothetical protein
VGVDRQNPKPAELTGDLTELSEARDWWPYPRGRVGGAQVLYLGTTTTDSSKQLGQLSECPAEQRCGGILCERQSAGDTANVLKLIHPTLTPTPTISKPKPALPSSPL